MRTLIRHHDNAPAEIMTEPFSPWVIANLAWLTGTETDSEGNPLPGDGWTLVEDYQPPVEAVPESPAETAEAVPETAGTVHVVSEGPKTILINGVEMTEEEVRRLLQS